MKRKLREWLPTTLLCGLLVSVAIASNQLMSARSGAPNAHGELGFEEDPLESKALTESRSVRRSRQPPNAPAACSIPSSSIPLDFRTTPVNSVEAESHCQTRPSADSLGLHVGKSASCARYPIGVGALREDHERELDLA